MKNPNKRLLHHLVIAVLIKLLVLTGLWWAFIRDAHVNVDADTIANRLGTVIQTSGENK